ncbi:MAG: aminotransferase class I/II-fold pyridoxal phosphate-dependent enzyme [candidate division KSB1 bacterium]|nr:aminotransferase class I/II-fold pyridoxal phosphate-dependent enzyme [candidate division KSB1 bacterium]
MLQYIDLRSDTVTKPSPEMRRAMAEAEVGDDVFGEDPTVNALQEKVAQLLGKEKALFVPSGTMANQICIRAQTQPGDEVIIDINAHVFNYESAAGAAISGIQFLPLPGKRGILEPEQVEAAIREPNVHCPPTRLICLENTHNRGGGSIYPLEKIARIRKIALEHGVLMHLDGARMMNACVATGIKPIEYARHFDSVMFYFSKGLGAPIGSIVAGSEEFIVKAHRYRKMHGGAMRQVGILAAAALYALEHNVERLAEDHRNAKKLARGLAEIKTIGIDPELVETNIVIFDVSKTGYSVAQVVEKFKEKGVLFVPFGKTLIRGVTHLDVSEEDVERAVEMAHEIFS